MNTIQVNTGTKDKVKRKIPEFRIQFSAFPVTVQEKKYNARNEVDWRIRTVPLLME